MPAEAVALNDRVPDPDLPDPAAMRRDYRERPPLTEEGLAETWLAQFQHWFADAVAAPEIVEPNAMIVASVGATGVPSARTVLLKGVDERGLLFFTNYHSRKGSEIAANPAVSLVFPWHPMGRQVIVGGMAEPVDRAETEAYFATRPRDSRLGAWASPQSQVVSRAELDAALTEVSARFGDDIPAPPHWGGLVVQPLTVEFWQGRTGRLHDRLRFRRRQRAEPEQHELSRSADGGWVVERLAP
jgi:pyridoxamine 5'-phosphate oxidase